MIRNSVHQCARNNEANNQTEVPQIPMILVELRHSASTQHSAAECKRHLASCYKCTTTTASATYLPSESVTAVVVGSKVQYDFSFLLEQTLYVRIIKRQIACGRQNPRVAVASCFHFIATHSVLHDDRAPRYLIESRLHCCVQSATPIAAPHSHLPLHQTAMSIWRSAECFNTLQWKLLFQGERQLRRRILYASNNPREAYHAATEGNRRQDQKQSFAHLVSAQHQRRTTVMAGATPARHYAC